jgi:hypothetical protein
VTVSILLGAGDVVVALAAATGRESPIAPTHTEVARRWRVPMSESSPDIVILLVFEGVTERCRHTCEMRS